MTINSLFKKRFSLIFGLFFLISSVFAQASNTGNDANGANPTSDQNSQQVSEAATDETQYTFGDDAGGAGSQGTRTGSGVGAVFRMILVLGIVVALIIFLFKFMKKKQNPDKQDDTYLRKIGSVSLGNGKSVQIVSLLEDAYILGVSDNSVNLIAKVEDRELVQEMNIKADKEASVKKPYKFQEILENIVGKVSKKSTSQKQEKNESKSAASGQSAYDGISGQVMKTLKRQRDMLDENGEE